MTKKTHFYRTVTAVALLLVMLASGLGSVKSYAYCGQGMYETNCNMGSIYDKVLKGFYRAEDALCNSYLEYAYQMANNKRYEFIGSTILKIAENSAYLKRNFAEEIDYSEGDSGFFVKNIRMEKAVQYWDNDDNLVISLYYKEKNDKKPAFVGYRFAKKSNPADEAIFLYYDMRGDLADIWVVGGFDERFNCNLYMAAYSSCDYLMKTAYNLVNIRNYEYAGPTVVKVAKNSTYLKRRFTEEIDYTTEEMGYYVKDIAMEKAVKYYNGQGAVISLYYKEASDRNPSYVVYRYEKEDNPDIFLFVTYDMQGNYIESWGFDDVKYAE